MECLFCLLASFMIGALLFASVPKGLKNFAFKHRLHYSMGIPMLFGAAVSGQYYGIPVRIYIRYNRYGWLRPHQRGFQLPELVYELRMGNCIPPEIEFYPVPFIPIASSVRCGIPQIDNEIHIRKVDPQTSHKLFTRPDVQNAVLAMKRYGRRWICHRNLLTVVETYSGSSTDQVEAQIEHLVSIVRSFQSAHTAALNHQEFAQNQPFAALENSAPKMHENPHQH